MKANELRIGNKLSDIHGRILTVNELRNNCVGCHYEGQQNTTIAGIRYSSFPYDDLHSIAITPELLGMCGFVISGDAEWVIPLPNGNGCDLFLEHILADNTIPYDVVLRAEKHFIYLHSITYLHQLQNLYHALTGNELEVKM